MSTMGKKTKRKFGTVLRLVLALAMVFTVFPQMSMQPEAAGAQTALLRMISTTDLHGQVSTTHYDTASQKPGSLVQVYTLIKEARSETDNFMTFDIGDSVYGYAADVILNNGGEDTPQPIYQAMARINYDAITLGNHDFDYGYAYIDKQLEMSGLKDKCVLSNVILTETGKTAYHETKMITKKLKMDNGAYRFVDVGIIGVTVPALSSYTNCKEDLMPLAIVKTVQKEAAALKSQGADLVVVLAHTSMGSEKPDDESDNAAYALTKLHNVDAVLAGHGHKNFPSSDEASSSFYNLPNTDAQTGLMNDKPITMVKDHGAGIGVIDLNLQISSSGKVSVKGASAGLRMVDQNTPSNDWILESQASVIGQVDTSLHDVVATLADNKKIDSYFALLEDNYAIQLVNESKIQYGLSYTGGAGKRLYADYPVVASTKYTLSGSQSAEDHISLNGTITMKDILNMQQANHNNNILYWVTGAQLRELLEWSASIYATADGSITSDEVLESLLQSRGAASIADAAWIDDWSNFAVFDGITYTIDATKPARYSKSGKLKNASSNRISEMSYNGQPIGADQKFILVCHTLSSNDATGAVLEQKVLGKTDMAYVHLLDYIKKQQAFGSIPTETDNNWRVLFDANREYIVRSSMLSQAEAAMKAWFRGLLSSNETFAYYLAQFIQADQADTDKPLLVVSATVSQETGDPVAIKVQASDRSGIAAVKWLPGQETADSANWAQAQTVADGSFQAESNGVYSVFAEDIYGNRIVKYITIGNIDKSTVQAPSLNRISNKGSVLTGTARYGLTVHISADGRSYEVPAGEEDTFSCTMERMATGTVITAYCSDAQGKMSKTVTTTVYKNGPNVPVLKEVSNKSVKIEGELTDSAQSVMALVDKDVYCAASDQELYLNSELYTKSRVVHPTEYVQTERSFSLTIPTPKAGQEIKVVSMDRAGRKSATVTVTAADEAPDQPSVFEICSLDDTLSGTVTNVSGPASVTVTAGAQQYTGTVAQDGTFQVPVGGFTAGDTVSVTVSDTKNGAARTSLAKDLTVLRYTDYTGTNAVTLDSVYNNSTVVTGRTDPNASVIVRVRGKAEKVTVDAAGWFTYALPQQLQAEEMVYAVARDAAGKIIGTAEQKVADPQPVVVVPETPSVLTGSITFSTEKIEVLTKETGTVVMNVGGVETSSQAGVFNQSYNGYIYEMALPPTDQEQDILIHFVNAQGVASGTVSLKRTAVAQ